MAKSYRCKHNDRLDQIVFKEYGDYNMMGAVLKANTHLHQSTLLIAMDTIITLPDAPKESQSTPTVVDGEGLW